MYQDELLAKREAYAAFVAQESDPSHFLSAWESLPHVRTPTHPREAKPRARQGKE